VHFEESSSNALGIARNILSNRLSRLVEAGILKREHCADDRRRDRIQADPQGHDPLPAMLALRQWGEKWEMNAPADPGVVRCPAMASPIAPIAIRAHDGRVLDGADLTCANGAMWKRQRRSNLPRTPVKRCTENGQGRLMAGIGHTGDPAPRGAEGARARSR